MRLNPFSFLQCFLKRNFYILKIRGKYKDFLQCLYISWTDTRHIEKIVFASCRFPAFSSDILKLKFMIVDFRDFFSVY